MEGLSHTIFLGWVRSIKQILTHKLRGGEHLTYFAENTPSPPPSLDAAFFRFVKFTTEACPQWR